MVEDKLQRAALERSGVAAARYTNCVICKKPGHVAENCYHLTKTQEAVSRKQNPNFFM